MNGSYLVRNGKGSKRNYRGHRVLQGFILVPYLDSSKQVRFNAYNHISDR